MIGLHAFNSNTDGATAHFNATAAVNCDPYGVGVAVPRRSGLKRVDGHNDGDATV